jgi:hypothetical protein
MPLSDEDGTPFCSHFDQANNWIHRAHQYSIDHPGLVGRDLSRKGHIAGDCAQVWSLWEDGLGFGTAEPDEPVQIPTGWGTSGIQITGAGGGGGAGGAGTGGTGGGDTY